MDATYDPTEGLNTNVAELVRCYVKCGCNVQRQQSNIMAYSARRLLSAQIYALNGYVLDDSPDNFSHYQAYIAQALIRLPVILHSLCFGKQVVYHSVKAKLIAMFGEAMFCILKPTIQTELEKAFRKREADAQGLLNLSFGKILRFLNTYFQSDRSSPPDWSAANKTLGSRKGADPLTIARHPSRQRSHALTPRHKRLGVLSNYHAVKRQLIGRFGEEIFTTHKSHVTNYLRRVSEFAVTQGHYGIFKLLNAKDGLAVLAEFLPIKDILTLSLVSRGVHQLVMSESVWEHLCRLNFPAQSCATQLLQLCYSMTWTQKYVMFSSQLAKRPVAAVVAPPPEPKSLRQWMAVLPPIAAAEAAAFSKRAYDIELAAGAPDFPNEVGTGGNLPFDRCIGMLGHPKAGVSTLLHSLSLNRDVASVEAVPRYKSVLITVRLRRVGTAATSNPAGSGEVRLLVLDLGSFVAPTRQHWFWRHANYTHIEEAAAQECHNSESEQSFHNLAALEGIVFCYDLGDTASFTAVKKFWARMNDGDRLPPKLQRFMFLGCKGDKLRKVPVPELLPNEITKAEGSTPLPVFCDCSARWNIGVQSAFAKLLQMEPKTADEFEDELFSDCTTVQPMETIA